MIGSAYPHNARWCVKVDLSRASISSIAAMYLVVLFMLACIRAEASSDRSFSGLTSVVSAKAIAATKAPLNQNHCHLGTSVRIFICIHHVYPILCNNCSVIFANCGVSSMICCIEYTFRLVVTWS